MAKMLPEFIRYPIIQVLMHAFEESDTLYALVLSGVQIFGTIFGVIIYYVASLVLLGVRGIWPLWAIIGLVIGTVTKFNLFFVMFCLLKCSFYQSSGFYGQSFWNLHASIVNTFSQQAQNNR